MLLTTTLMLKSRAVLSELHTPAAEFVGALDLGL